jgi:mRNA interferase RelE/StbE
MRVLSADIPPHVAEVIRRLPPDVKRSVRQAVCALVRNPQIGTPLIGELAGLWKYRVRRFRIVYEVNRAHGAVRIVAVGHRRGIYDEVTEAVRRVRRARAAGDPPTACSATSWKSCSVGSTRRGPPHKRALRAHPDPARDPGQRCAAYTCRNPLGPP